MSGALLRASEIPRMVDVDGHIDENLLRYGRGCYVRALAEVLEPRWEDEQEGDEWAYQRDAYDHWAADEWMPQPPSALDLWELDLYEISAPATRSLGGCGCFPCRTTGYTPALRSYRSGFEGFAATLAPIFDEASAWMTLASRAMDELNRSMSVRFDTAAFLGAWTEPEPPPKPVVCPDLAVADAPPRPPDRFTLDRLTRPPEPPVIKVATGRSLRAGRSNGPDHQPFRRRGIHA